MRHYCRIIISLFVLISRVASFSINPSVVSPRGSLLQLHAQLDDTTSTKNKPLRKASAVILSPLTIISATMPIIPATDLARTCIGIYLARRISNSGLKKKSLNKEGAFAAFIVASLSLATSWRNGITLLSFYWTSSKLTRVGSKIKGKLEEGVTEGGERGSSQVFACSLIAVLCACVRRVLIGSDGALLIGGDVSLSPPSLALFGDQLTLAYVAFFACCAGDTWASELGILSKSLPRLITKPWKSVPPGTNGGMSLVGTAASAAGGTLMGIIHGLFVPGGTASILPFMSSSITPSQYAREIVVLSFVGFMGGLGGSLIDSFLGATIQATYYDGETKRIAKRGDGYATKQISGYGFLSNEMVNVVSTALSALIAALISKPILSWI